MMLNINNTLSADNPRMMFVTLIVGVLNIKTGEIIYANGGHNPPIIASEAAGQTDFVQGLNEPLVGAMVDVSYTDRSFTLSPGDSFFLYTDGVNEAMNSEAELYSDEKLLEEVEKHRTESSSEVVQAVLDSVRDHSQSAPQSDDIAMLMIKYHGTVDIGEPA
jgi:sigma-B regulation protein RsbU (phosphoserine phosphatase)